MAFSKLPPSTKVLAKDAKAMIAAGGWSRDERLSRALLAQIWRHDDGRALTRFGDGGCRMYQSHADLTAWYDEADRHARRGFRWDDVIPQGAAFPERVPDLLRELPRVLGVAWTPSADVLPELDLIEGAVRRLGQDRVLVPDVLPSVVAYVGELIRRRVGGEWTTQDSGHGHEPDLMVQGTRCGVMGVDKEIMEYGRAVSLRAFVEHHVRVRGG
jgi:hypothetical protein